MLNSMMSTLNIFVFVQMNKENVSRSLAFYLSTVSRFGSFPITV